MEQLTWIRSERRLVTLDYAGAYGARSPRLAGARPVRQCVTPSTGCLPSTTRNNNNCIRQPPPTMPSPLLLLCPQRCYRRASHQLGSSQLN